MFFEGAEKKVEIIVKPTVTSLMEIPRDYWQELVESCQAEIISEIKNDKIIAFLLSESSLFIWKDRILMVTCGQTLLINSIKEFIGKFFAENIDMLIYQRKNECFSRLQPTSFHEDVKMMSKVLPGKALRFGKSHGHYNQLYYMESDYQAPNSDQTSEVLMYDLDETIINKLIDEKYNNQEVRDLLGLEGIIGDYEVDDFVFKPFGYSLNAIKGEHYLTIHISPEPNSSYASLEFSETSRAKEFIDHILNAFKPRSFDTMSFNLKLSTLINNYNKIEYCHTTIPSGYQVEFCSFFANCEVPIEPEEIK